MGNIVFNALYKSIDVNDCLGRETRITKQDDAIMAKFLTELDARLKGNSDDVWIIRAPLIYHSDIAGTIEVPIGFETDLSSVPRIPIVFWFYGKRAHREGVIHDYLFRIDSNPGVDMSIANKVFFEAMDCRGKGIFIKYPMYWGVKFGGFSSYHKKMVGDKIGE
jgi:hypothetical protein